MRLPGTILLWAIFACTAVTAHATPPADETDARRLARYAEWRAGERDPGRRWDCAWCPEMAVVPAGAFTLGSPPGEPARRDDEGPQRRIAFGVPMAVSRYEITRDE